MAGLLKKLALTGGALTALALSSLSCSTKSQKPEEIFQKRVAQYQVYLENKELGLKVPESEFRDVKEYLETGKVPDYVTNPDAKMPVEQPIRIKVVKTNQTQPSLFSQETEEPRWSISPYVFQKSKFDDSDDIGPYTGAGIRVKRDLNSRLGLYGKLEFDSASDTQSTSISRAELKSTGTSFGGGITLTPVKTNNFEIETYLGAQFRHEKNDGYIQVLDAKRNISESETMGGWEAGARATFTTNSGRFGAYAGAGLEEAGDSGLGYRVEGGVIIKF